MCMCISLVQLVLRLFEIVVGKADFGVLNRLRADVCVHVRIYVFMCLCMHICAYVC